MSKNMGKQFEREVIQAFKRHYPEAWIERMSDKTGTGHGGKAFGVKSAPDLIVIRGIGAVLLECKAVKGTAIALNRLAPHQADSLRKFHNLSDDHVGCIAVLFYNGLKGKERLKRAWLTDINEWEKTRTLLNRKSLPMSWLERERPNNEMHWIPGEGWYFG